MKDAAKKVETLIEPSLKDSKLRYRRLFDAAQDGILILDAGTGMIEEVNPYLIKMLGKAGQPPRRPSAKSQDEKENEP